MSRKNSCSLIKFFQIISCLVLIELLFLRICNELEVITQKITFETMIFAVIMVVLFSLIED